MYVNLEGASKLLNVSKETLRRWDRNGKLKAERTNGGHRKYKRDELIAFNNSSPSNAEFFKVQSVENHNFHSLILGKSGSGKTELIKTIAKMHEDNRANGLIVGLRKDWKDIPFGEVTYINKDVIINPFSKPQGMTDTIWISYLCESFQVRFNLSDEEVNIFHIVLETIYRYSDDIVYPNMVKEELLEYFWKHNYAFPFGHKIIESLKLLEIKNQQIYVNIDDMDISNTQLILFDTDAYSSHTHLTVDMYITAYYYKCCSNLSSLDINQHNRFYFIHDCGLYDISSYNSGSYVFKMWNEGRAYGMKCYYVQQFIESVPHSILYNIRHFYHLSQDIDEYNIFTSLGVQDDCISEIKSIIPNLHIGQALHFSNRKDIGVKLVHS